MRRNGFTLVELLVVVVVIVTLMGITFRISNAGSDSTARNATVNRIQRIENCLSGYYAAYGSYPPVKLHGSRNFRYQVNKQGIQQVGKGGGGGSGGTMADGLNWDSVIAACRSQPIGMEYPFTRDVSTYIKKVSDVLMARHNSDDPRYAKYQENMAYASGFQAMSRRSDINNNDKIKSPHWTDTQVFKFGLLSYLLPRYLIMMGSRVDTSGQIYSDLAQWTENNDLPCRFEDGLPYSSWRDLNEDVRNNTWKVAVLPSQAICARWLVNLSGILVNKTPLNLSAYGTWLTSGSSGGSVGVDSAYIRPYSNSESQGGTGGYSQQYILDGITIIDGWQQELYYYSPAPYQTYRVWSSGPNKCTFPPWVTNEEFRELSQGEREQAETWMADDIVQMSN